MHSVVGDYLEAIYSLTAEGDDAVNNVTLAGLFGVSRQAVSATVLRLARDGFIETNEHRLRLTPAGTDRAEEGLRRHCIAERFLADVLGLAWDAVHEQAKTFEQGLTPLLEDRIDARLGHPTTCPHGNPVPRPECNAATYFRDQQAVTLARAPLQSSLQVLAISEIAERSVEWLRRCASLGLLPGSPVQVHARTGSRVDLLLAGTKEPATIEAALAARIWAVRLPTEEER
ncbi:MAG: metal-dependent transcriptional regulator [Chloroflexi bacterium]|nr:metal-dependent transcriptional regulator [Chloroflexota bacterium]